MEKATVLQKILFAVVMSPIVITIEVLAAILLIIPCIIDIIIHRDLSIFGVYKDVLVKLHEGWTPIIELCKTGDWNVVDEFYDSY